MKEWMTIFRLRTLNKITTWNTNAIKWLSLSEASRSMKLSCDELDQYLDEWLLKQRLLL